MNKTKHFKRTALNLSAKSMVSLMLLLIAMLMPQGAWAANHYDAGYESTATTYSAAGIKFKITAVRMYNYQGNNSQFRSNPLVTITADGHTHTFYLGSLTSNTGKDTFYYNGEGNENPYKGSGSFSKVTYQQTVDGIPVKAYFDNQKNEQRVSTNPDKTYKDNGDGSSKWCTADLTIEIGVQTAAMVTIAGNWGDYSDGINKTESYSWPFSIPKHTCNSDNATSTTYPCLPATCEQKATYYMSCSFCGAKQSGTFEGSALGHDHTSKTTTSKYLKDKATCDANATYWYKCTRCEDMSTTSSYTSTDDKDKALGHNYNADGICTRNNAHFQNPKQSDGYYQIANYGNLCWFRDKVNSGSYTINAMQTADITIPDGVTWGGIGSNLSYKQGFKGTYDGNGHTINNLKINKDDTGLFNYITGATIKNLGLKNVSLSDKSVGLVHTAYSSSNISNCYVTGYAKYPLCLENRENSTIANCFAKVDRGFALVNINRAEVKNCYTNIERLGSTSGDATWDDCRGSVIASTFASGEITYLLNSGKTDGTQVWYQKLGAGGDATPTLVKNTSNTVYKRENLKCDGVTKNGSVSYSNSTTAPVPVDAHTWANTTTYSLSAADCTHDAVYYMACSVCNAKGSETWTATGTALDHDYHQVVDADYRVSAATCTKDAKYQEKCSRCTTHGAEWTDEGTMLNHIMTEHAAHDATCTEAGNLLYYTCSQPCCSGKYYKDNAEHTTDAYADFDATVIATLAHDYHQVEDADYLVSAATCAADAVYHEKCSGCTTHGAEWTALGTKLPHTFDDNDLTQGHCTVCDHGFFRYTATAKVEPYSKSELKNADQGIYDSKKHTFDGKNGVMEFDKPLTSIGPNAFRGRSGFTGDLTIPNTVTTIGYGAFEGCSNFTGNLTIPNSVTSIGFDAFWGCSGFKGNLIIGNSVMSIGSYAFYECYGFTGNLTIPNSITSIGESVFEGCSGFNGNLSIPNSVTSIGESAFDGCSGLTGNLTIPNSVKSIGESAFAMCSGFTGNLTIPNSVKSIGNYAFFRCSGLTGIELQSVPQIGGSNTFVNVTSNKTVVLSDDSYVYTEENPYFPTVASVTAPCNLDLTDSAVEKHGNITRTHGYTNNTLTASPVEDGLYAYVCDNGCGAHSDTHVIKDFNGEGNHLELTKYGEGYSAERVEIEDGKAFSTPVAFTTSNVTMSRTFTQSSSDAVVPATIMLPFCIEADKLATVDGDVVRGTKFYGFTSLTQNAETGKWQANMDRVTGTVEAYTPYMIVLTEGTAINFDDNEVTFAATPAENHNTTQGDWTFVGTSERKVWTDEDFANGEVYYGYAASGQSTAEAGKFVKVGVDASIKPLRSYIMKTPVAAGPKNAPTRATDVQVPSTIAVHLNELFATGIGELNIETGEFTFDGWYDLNGNRISEPVKNGISIKNNKKVIIK